MKLHGNAALSWSGRRRLAERVVGQGWTLAAAAAAAGVNVRCAASGWVGIASRGRQGLLDRSSAPQQVWNRTPVERVEVILALRRLRMTAAEIAELPAGRARPRRRQEIGRTEGGADKRVRVGLRQQTTAPSPTGRGKRRNTVGCERLLTDNGSA